MNARITIGVAAALVLTACGGENSNEKLADTVTRAIVANDMRPVEKDFNAIVRPKLENRAAVGRLSDELVPLGNLKRVKETTQGAAQPNRHTFVAEFEKGTQAEDMTLDSDGKIEGFHIRPNAATSPE